MPFENNDSLKKLMVHVCKEDGYKIYETGRLYQKKVLPMGDGLEDKYTKIHNNYFDKLPDELVLNIFKLLDKYTLRKCAYVCSRWQNIVYDASLWESFNTIYCFRSVKALDYLLKHNIKYLSVSSSSITDATNNTFGTPFTKLLYLDLSHVFMKIESLTLLLSQCSNLIKLSLEHCEVDHACCENIGRNTKLKVLSMAFTSGLDKFGLKHILSLNNLEEFNISRVYNIKDEDLQYLLTNMVPSIKRLNISGYFYQIADCDFKTMICRCQSLIELDISNNLAIAGDGIDFLLNNLQNLNVLHANHSNPILCRLLQPDVLRLKLSKGIRKLKELNIFGIKVTSDIYDSILPSGISINKKMNSEIAHAKLEGQLNTIWEITSFLECWHQHRLSMSNGQS